MMDAFLLVGSLGSGLPEKDVKRRYVASVVTFLASVVAVSASYWGFRHWPLPIAIASCIACVAIVFVVTFWTIGRFLPPKIRTMR
ncbi:MAG TPA: hypothetical protein VJN90_12090 [Candidatus Acidoferrales bacterium]|nr:hypothetical protein [Candidatus Acidoferrales bacterium]